MNNDLFYKIALSMIPGVGSILARKLLSYSGDAESIFSGSVTTLQKIKGIGEVLAKQIKSKTIFEKAERELKFIEKYQIGVWFYTDSGYPRRLKACSDAPVILYSKGDININEERIISIVGTRHATSYGKSLCRALVESFAARNYKVVIISGLAYGIDIFAHETALNNGISTVGVLGHGLDKIYPSQHTATARSMLNNGGLITDFPSGTKIDPSNFIRRNRIIAGLSDATIVVESAVKGGALITADIASSYNRDVFAFPGRVGENYSKGCNNLIMMNGATLIQSIDDLEYFMGWDEAEKAKISEPNLFIDLTDIEKEIIKLLQNQGALFIDQISSELNLTSSKTSNLMITLEFKNIVELLPGNVYQLKQT